MRLRYLFSGKNAEFDMTENSLHTENSKIVGILIFEKALYIRHNKFALPCSFFKSDRISVFKSIRLRHASFVRQLLLLYCLCTHINCTVLVPLPQLPLFVLPAAPYKLYFNTSTFFNLLLPLFFNFYLFVLDIIVWLFLYFQDSSFLYLLQQTLLD